ncbi:MAG: S8 family serine peptidase [Acidobacteriota bacterium]|nr:S8 family serine peptidase [Acidobacteriota bacterium]
MPAEAQQGRNGNDKPAKAVAGKVNKPVKVRHAKMDQALSDRADSVGESDVIVVCKPGKDCLANIKAAGGKGGRRLGIINGQTGRMPNALLKRLANDPDVAGLWDDRETNASLARTAAAIGAKNVHAQYGYNGAGVGVAVIDSGITPWHDDLTVANREGQRVTAFVDFVNGQTSKYDDWGHGTHVSGIIAGNGYDSTGSRQAIAPGANIISLKALDGEGKGKISYIIAALDWAVANRTQYNIRVINMSLGAGVFESYHTDPLTQAAKRAVDAGIVVVAAAGNMGKAANGQPQYGAIGAPGNAPWVLTVGASSTMGTIDRRDDTIALYSSRGPTMIDFAAKPDLVAPGSGTVSLSDRNSLFYSTKAAYLVPGKRIDLTYLPYLTLSGTSMAAPVVSGTVALMLQANPALTPNMVKAILQFTSQADSKYNYLTQGAGFLNTLGAVRLSRFFAVGGKGDRYPTMKAWSKHIFWGNRRVTGGVLTPGGTAWGQNIVWGDALTPVGQNIVWGENCADGCDNIVWGNNIVWGASDDTDNIVWGNTDNDNIVWGNSDSENIVWGNGSDDNIVWGNGADENIVWGNDCAGADCDNIVWGNTDDDNIVWGNADGIENIVWGNSADENVVWGNSGDDGDNISWGSSAGDGEDFGDDTAELDTFDPLVFEDLFGGEFELMTAPVVESQPAPETTPVVDPLPAIEPEPVTEPVATTDSPPVTEPPTTGPVAIEGGL